MGFHWTGDWAKRHRRRVLMLLALLAGLLPVAPAWAGAIESVAVDGGRIVIRFDGTVDRARSVVLAPSRQVAVDVDGAMPGGGLRMVGSGLPRAIRQQVVAPGTTRIVFDLGQAAIVDDGAFDAAGQELTLRLKPVAADTFQAAGLAGPIEYFPFDLSGFARRAKYKLSIPVPPPAKPAPLPAVHGDDTRPLVVIDAGHGGVDPGAINPQTGLREKDVTLRIAKTIRDELLASGRVRVALTRDDDRYLVLRERFGIARRLHADLFISIHCDSTTSPDATGASVYTLSEVASDKEAAHLAARENKADVIQGVDLDAAGADVSSILIDLAQRETMNSSATFARLLGREAKPLMPTKPNFHRMASLMVLKAPDMPSVLLETGYISNPTDAAFLDSPDGRKRIAESVERAVEVHFARRMASR